jgi:membrane fusion protein (multidrug efflux system)
LKPLNKDALQELRLKRWRQRLFGGFFVLLAGAAVMGAAWWYFVAQRYVSTDDAYVGASIAQVTPFASGAVAAVPVDNTQMVKRGAVLLVIDPQDAKLQLAAAQAGYGLAVRKVATYFADVEARQADYDNAQLAYRRRASLAKNGAVSNEDLTAARNDVDVAKAALDAALALTQGTTVATNPEVLAAKAALDTAALNLTRTVVRAPVDGVVAQRQVQVGQWVQAGVPVMTIVPISQVYADANFKENQLGRVRPGQPVTLTSDLYGQAVIFHGRVVGLAGGSGAAFAIIPAENATGNWISVVQRVPVRISLDPDELRRHPLLVGLSLTATIDIAHAR